MRKMLLNGEHKHSERERGEREVERERGKEREIKREREQQTKTRRPKKKAAKCDAAWSGAARGMNHRACSSSRRRGREEQVKRGQQ